MLVVELTFKQFMISSVLSFLWQSNVFLLLVKHPVSQKIQETAAKVLIFSLNNEG